MNSLSSGWKLVVTVVAPAMALWAVAVTVITGEVIPPVLIIGILFLVLGALLISRPNRATAALFGVLGLFTIVGNFPFIIDALVNPESAIGFNTTTWPVLAAVLAIIVSVGLLRRASDAVAPRLLAGAGAVFAIGLVFSVILAAGIEDDLAASDDRIVVAEDVEFGPSEIEAVAGSVGVFVTNKDPVRHTFTIDELGVDLDVPEGSDQRVEFTAAAGSYRFFCSVPGHEDMEGTLLVTG